MSEIAKIETANVPQVTEMASGLLMIIERAARDPNVEIDKMERLLEMQERVQSRHAKTAYYSALADMQPNLPIICERGGIKDRNNKIQSTYALWEDVNEGIRPILAEYGFALSFKVSRTESAITTIGILSHREGHCESTELSLPSDTSGSKNVVQAIGSSGSYGKRYTAYALLNITSRGDDDDGKAGGNVAEITLEQLDELLRRASEVGADVEAFCRYMKVTALSALPASRFKEAMANLDAKKAKGATQ